MQKPITRLKIVTTSLISFCFPRLQHSSSSTVFPKITFPRSLTTFGYSSPAELVRRWELWCPESQIVLIPDTNLKVTTTKRCHHTSATILLCIPKWNFWFCTSLICCILSKSSWWKINFLRKLLSTIFQRNILCSSFSSVLCIWINTWVIYTIRTITINKAWRKFSSKFTNSNRSTRLSQVPESQKTLRTNQCTGFPAF